MNRGEPAAASQTAVLVDPTSVTVQSSALASSTVRTCAASRPTGTATTASSAPPSASPRVGLTSSTAPRSSATSAVASSSSNPETVAPARFAASPTEAPISPVPMTASRKPPYPTCLPMRATSSVTSGELAELVRRDLLRAVAERLLGPRMRLDDDPVRADRRRRPRQGQDERPPPGGVGGVDDHRQVRLLLEHRDRAEVERVPGRGLEGLDSPLAEDDPVVPLPRDVLGRHQELLHGRGRPALEQHRLVDPPDLRQEQEVLHVAGADLDHVGDLDHLLDVPWVDELGDDREAGLLPGLAQHLEGVEPQSLERVRRGARLERAAAEHRRTGGGDRPGRLERLLPVLDRARAGDQAEERVADLPPRTSITVGSGTSSRATSLYGLRIGSTRSTPGKPSSGSPASASRPDRADHRRLPTVGDAGVRARLRSRATTCSV